MGLFGNWGEKRKRAICQISTLTMIISSSLPSQKIPRPKNFDCGNSCRVLQLIFRRNPFIHPSTSVIISRADRKSQVRQCLGFCTSDLWSSSAYESAEQKPKHFITWDFLSALIISSIKRVFASATALVFPILASPKEYWISSLYSASFWSYDCKAFSLIEGFHSQGCGWSTVAVPPTLSF